MPLQPPADPGLLVRPRSVHDGLCFVHEVRQEEPRSREANLHMIDMLLKTTCISTASTSSHPHVPSPVALRRLSIDPIPAFGRSHTVHTKPLFAQVNADCLRVPSAQLGDWQRDRVERFLERQWKREQDAEELTPPQKLMGLRTRPESKRGKPPNAPLPPAAAGMWTANTHVRRELAL